MTEKSNALARAQLLMLHADTIENDSIKNMVIDSATEFVVLHDEIERLRGLLLRIRHWDHLDGAADGLFWKREIEQVLQEVPR